MILDWDAVSHARVTNIAGIRAHVVNFELHQVNAL